MTAVRLESVSKCFDKGEPALAEVSLSVHPGELLVLLGPSGSGKTTLLRLIAGLETPTQGGIFLGERDVTRAAPWKRNVAIVFQRPALYPQRTVRENLLAGVRLATPWWRRTPAVPLDKIAATLDLTDLLERRPHQLSGGQQQRVALGRALLRQPDVLLLDEPLTGLEISLRLELRRELHLLQRQRRATMIYVTHDPQEALALGDRLAILERGRLVQMGTPAEIRQRPANLFAAGLGLSIPYTMLSGVARHTDTGIVFQTGSLSCPVPLAVPEMPLQVLLPLQALHLTESANGINGEVMLVEAAAGEGWLVTINASGQLWTVATSTPPSAKQQVRVAVDWHQARWFDAAGHSLAIVE